MRYLLLLMSSGKTVVIIIKFFNVTHFIETSKLQCGFFKCFSPKCFFSFTWLKIYHHPKVQSKWKSHPMVTWYALQCRIPRWLIHSDESLTEKKNCHKCMLWLLPWFLLNFSLKLISNSLYVKVVSEQHTGSECLLQQPREEDHWIQSWN